MSLNFEVEKTKYFLSHLLDCLYSYGVVKSFWVVLWDLLKLKGARKSYQRY